MFVLKNQRVLTWLAGGLVATRRSAASRIGVNAAIVPAQLPSDVRPPQLIVRYSLTAY